MAQHSTAIRGVSASGYAAARQRAAWFPRLDRGRIAVRGRDRASYLQGLLTNDIVQLKPGEGCYAAYLTPQGRMISDVFVHELGDVMLLSVPIHKTAAVLERLDQFVFTEDVQLGDLTDSFAELAVVGPHAAAVVADVVEGADARAIADLGEYGNCHVTVEGEHAILLRMTDMGEPGYSMLVDGRHAARVHQRLREYAGEPIDASTAEAIRIEGGVPRFGRDMDEDTIPLEAGIEARAISFSKGCYVGQEVIVRVLHRGHGRVARKLVGLTIESDGVPDVGGAIRQEGREVGRVTSATWSPRLGKPIALGYVQRDFAAPGTELVIGDGRAIVTALPFVTVV